MSWSRDGRTKLMTTAHAASKKSCKIGKVQSMEYSWLRGTAVEGQSLAGELSLSCARPVSDG